MTNSNSSDAKSKYVEVVDMPTAKLNNGEKIPIIGMGTWKAEGDKVGNSVRTAIRLGYRHIDCAAIYGNEDQVGRAFKEVFDEGVVPRQALYITSKLWNAEHKAENVEKACRQTLKNLQLEYLNEYLMHWPVAGNTGPTVDPPIQETWQAMEKLVDEGLVKSIGISNFSVAKTEALLKYARITPAVNQVEVHPYFRNDYLINYCKSKGIHVTAYSPLGSPDSASEFNKEEAPKLMQDPVLTEIAKAKGKSPAQICIRWGIQHGTSVIPKGSSEEHIKDNFDVFDWELTAEEYKKLCSLKHQMRMVDGSMFLKPEGPYKTLKELWDGELPEENPVAVAK